MEQVSNFPFNLFDAGVIILVIGSALFAYARGFVHEMCSIAGWVGAILATIYGFEYAQPYARQLINMSILADLAAGTLIFLCALVTLSIFTNNISSRIRDSALNSIDRALGFLFGLARGALIIVIVYIGIEFLVPHKRQPEWFQNARTIQLVKPAADFLISILPESYALKRHKKQTGSKKSKTQKEAGAIVRELITPVPNATKQKKHDGYGVGERQDMERLIRNTQPK